MSSFTLLPRRLAMGLAAAVFATSTGGAFAADPCMRPAEKTAFTLAALKSQLMVTAISCQAETQYNTFVAQFRNDLQGVEKNVNSYFNRTAGRRAQQAHDDYITSLANTQSEDGLKQGTDFCGKRLPMLTDVLALKDSKGLMDYAATAPVVQAIDTTECPPPPEKKPAKAAAKTASTPKPAATTPAQ